MSAFETVQLEPITDPIMPDVSFGWKPLLVTSVLIVGVTVFVVALVTVCLRFYRKQKKNRKPWEIKVMRKIMSAENQTRIDPTEVDLDRYWELVQGFFINVGVVRNKRPSIDEFREQIEASDRIDSDLKQRFLVLLPMVEAYKYQNASNADLNKKTAEVFFSIFRDILKQQS